MYHCNRMLKALRDFYEPAMQVAQFLPRYSAAFKLNNVTVSILLDLTDEWLLNDLGITNNVHRRGIMERIVELRSSAAAVVDQSAVQDWSPADVASWVSQPLLLVLGPFASRCTI